MKRLLTIVIAALAFAPVARGQWVQTNGRRAGYISSFVATGDAMIAATDSGILRKSRKEDDWQGSNQGIDENDVISLASNGKLLFSVTIRPSGSSVYCSTDQGISWNQVGFLESYIMDIVAVDSMLYANASGNLFFSDDFGESWSSCTLPCSCELSNQLATTGNALVVGSDSGVFCTKDQGQTWKQLNVPANEGRNEVAASGKFLFVQNDAGIFYSTDVGESWRSVGQSEGFSLWGVLSFGNWLFLASEGDTLLRSSDNGVTWDKVGIGFNGFFIRPLAVYHNILFAGTANGEIYHSTDFGSSWVNDINSGFEGSGFNSQFAMEGTNLFVASDDGVFRTTNNGVTWKRVDSARFVQLRGDSFSERSKSNIWTNHPISLLESTSAYSNDSQLIIGVGLNGGAFRSSDAGDHWADVSVSQTQYSISSIITDGATYFAGTRGDGIFRSTSTGRKWKAVNRGLPSNAYITVLSKFRSKLYVGTFGDGLFCSTNNGDSWEQKKNGLTNDTITAITTTHGRLFAATYGGLFTSVTNGDSWVNCGLPATSFISYVTTIDSTILVGTWGEGIFRSSNFGYSWSQFNEGLDERYALRVGCLSANNNYLFVGFFGSSGIWRRPLDQLFE